MLTDPVNSPPPENVPDTGSVSEACAVKDGSAAAGIAATSDNVIASPATLQNTVFIGSPCLSGPPEIRRHARGNASTRPERRGSARARPTVLLFDDACALECSLEIRR